jgi:glucose/arabinose dehydrogenase
MRNRVIMRLRRLTLLVAVLGAAALVLSSCGAAEQPGTPSPSPSSPSSSAPVVALDRIPGDFSEPLYLTAPPGDTSRLFVVEKGGLIRIVKDDVLAEPFLDLSDSVSGGSEQGLLSLAFAPDFERSGELYVNFTDEDGTTKVARFTVRADDPDRADASSRVDLLSVPQPYENHNGGQLQFGPDGLLYVGMGDGGGAGDPEGRAQDPDSLLGKILRLDVAGGAAGPEVYAHGLRNPWRFSFDRKEGGLWIADVGQNEREEVSYLPPETPPGANLGWRGYEGSQEYDAATARQLDRDELVWPVAEYGHDVGESVTGGYVYRGAAVPALRGHYLFADFVSGHVWAMQGPNGEPRLLEGADRQVESISSFGEDARGELYITSLEGSVFRIVAR